MEPEDYVMLDNGQWHSVDIPPTQVCANVITEVSLGGRHSGWECNLVDNLEFILEVRY